MLNALVPVSRDLHVEQPVALAFCPRRHGKLFPQVFVKFLSRILGIPGAHKQQVVNPGAHNLSISAFALDEDALV